MSAEPRGEVSFSVSDQSVLSGSQVTGQLYKYLASLLNDGFPPGFSLAVVEGHGVTLQAFGGYSCLFGEIRATTSKTCYDLASLTKVVCTVTLALVASQRGILGLDEPLVNYLPGFPESSTTIRHLLTHSSGLVDHRPFFETVVGRAEIEAAICAEAVGSVPGSQVRYSDLNFMLLGWALEECFGAGLDEVFSTQVAEPLGMSRTCFRPPRSERPLIAATELDGDQRLTAGLVWGEVHDGNAFALGGVAGHAGLFAPLADMACFVRHLLSPDGTVLIPDSVSLMSSRQAGEGEDVRGIGWRLQPTEWGHWSACTIWHTGFTGTSVLVDLERKIGVVLLTNAVHPRRRVDDQAAVRATVHRLVAEALG